MAATKTVTYTQEQTAELRDAYLADSSQATVDAFAAKFSKSVRSIVAKLSREGIYKKKKKEYVSKTGEKPVKKEAMADEFQAIFGLTESEADSITKANKTALKKILDFVRVDTKESF